MPGTACIGDGMHVTACMLAGRGCHNVVNARASIPGYKTPGDSTLCIDVCIVSCTPLQYNILSSLPSGKNERLPGLVESSSGECRSCLTA